MWDGSEGWEKAVHIPFCVTYVTKENLMVVKRTLTYLAMKSGGGENEIVAGREVEGRTGGWVRRE